MIMKQRMRYYVVTDLTDNLVDNAKVRAIWTSPEYCHCNFTVRERIDEQRFAAWTNRRPAAGSWTCDVATVSIPCWKPAWARSSGKAT